jgi:hypothetical protein
LGFEEDCWSAEELPNPTFIKWRWNTAMAFR